MDSSIIFWATSNQGGITYAVEHSNLAGKVILFILLIASIYSWSIMLTKFVSLKMAKKQSKDFLNVFRADRKPLRMYEARVNYKECPLYEIYQAACKELSYLLLGSDERDETYKARISTAGKIRPIEMESIRAAMDRAVGEEGLRLESQMIVLASAVSGGPFLGLLGTVWGVMDTFTGIALAGRADLLAMAPGVSGALITTALSLTVAIPAMFGYNYLITSVRSLTVEMENFSAELAAQIERHYVNHDRNF
ncbi:MAG: MotA/TolQ/ExbB proton channel family protein [Verrucomicrobiota bacterium]|nr:MotA/TolQ/ExbB proton channel family protein [Verrucomicrobiota bacterium]